MDGEIRLVEEVLAENPQLRLMRDPPLLAGKQVGYVTVFRVEEEGKPVYSFYRARSLLPQLESMKGEPAGWEFIRRAVLEMFG